MKSFLCASVTWMFAAWVLVGNCDAEKITPELAVLKSDGVSVNWLAFSADGSRLAAGMKNRKIDTTGKSVAIPGEAIVWDVDKQRKVCSCQNPKAEFTYLWMSADGKTIVTADQGTSNLPLLSFEWVPVMVTHGYQAWDATTGRTIGPLISPQMGQFTAASVSADGRYIATVWNEYPIGPSAPLKTYVEGQIRVWDLRAGSAKWTLPGAPHRGAITWSDSLALSPDGTQLAVYRTFDAPWGVYGGLGSGSSQPLKMLTLVPGNSAPTVRPLEKGGIPLPQRMEWPGNGRTIVLRNQGAFELVSLETGQRADAFTLHVPDSLDSTASANPAGSAGPSVPPQDSGMPPRQPGSVPRRPSTPPPARFQPPAASASGRGSSASASSGLGSTPTALSADGSRFAALLHLVRPAKGVTETHVAIWDMGSHRFLGATRLPDEPYSPKEQIKRQANDRPDALALAGDGKRLAVSDHAGTVHVYDISGLSASEPGQPNAPAKSDQPQIATIRSSFEGSMQSARNRLLASFDAAIKELDGAAINGNDKSAALAVVTLKEEKQRFERDGLIPWSRPMWKAAGEYLDSVGAAVATVHAAIAGDMPADLRDMVDKRVVAKWRHQPGNRLLVFYAGGKFVTGGHQHSWSFADGHLTFHWQDGFVTNSTLATDGQSYTGRNQQNRRVSGAYVDDTQ